jgi:hypothetical protein
MVKTYYDRDGKLGKRARDHQKALVKAENIRALYQKRAIAKKVNSIDDLLKLNMTVEVKMHTDGNYIMGAYIPTKRDYTQPEDNNLKIVRGTPAELIETYFTTKTQKMQLYTYLTGKRM